jgi:dipeptidyl aminopeptidase/acylaminoacyl peptidase
MREGVRGVLAGLLLTITDVSLGQAISSIPHIPESEKRLISVDDVMSLRSIDTLSVSRDKKHFAIFVRQADPKANNYRAGWFVGDVNRGALVFVGEGGELGPRVLPAGDIIGDVGGSDSQWSADGRWIAYTLQRHGEVQLWRSRTDGSAQAQLTHSAGDVREFVWSLDGTQIYFVVGTSRVEQRKLENKKSREGYLFDEDLYTFTDFMKPKMWRSMEEPSTLWVVSTETGAERVGSAADRRDFARAIAREQAGVEPDTGFIDDAAVSPVVRADGAKAWLDRSGPSSRYLKVVASLPSQTSPQACDHERCSGALRRLWWSSDGDRVLFWRGEGINDRVHAFYAWSPRTNILTTLVRLQDDDLQRCVDVLADEVLCVRETPTRPAHLARIRLQSGSIEALVDVNPELKNIRLGRVERFEWDTPEFGWNETGGALAGLYPKRAYGYLLYPPDFVPGKKYPVFIDPYIAHGFNRPGAEHPIHVYAAQGFIVLNTAFPLPNDVLARLGATAMKQTYSMELNYPHMTMLMESTVSALRKASSLGILDETKVGIGGVSHGSFVPLYMMQKYDLIAAISISSPTWGPHEYYWGTAKIRQWIPALHGKAGSEDWRVRPEGEGREFWSRIDIADHIDAVEAPILMQLAADETYALVRLIRHLSDAAKPYETYVFADETHYKWQPAHIEVIMNRNLDWFRFWLQGREDSHHAKKEQYARWNKLRLQQQSPLTMTK